MSIAFTRGFRRAAIVCLGVALASAASVASASTAETAHVRVARTADSDRVGVSSEVRGFHSNEPVKLGDVMAYSPTTQQPLTVVYLHGIHGKASNGCPYMKEGANEVGWLVCPRADVRKDDGTATWSLDVRANGAVVNGALASAQAKGASPAPGVAVGFSQGGYVTLDLVKSGQSHFRGLVLIAAPEAHPSAAKLHEMGVERVVLAAGRRDAAYVPLFEDAQRLKKEGMDVKFVDLGDVGHTYAATNTDGLRDAIVWAGGRS